MLSPILLALSGAALAQFQCPDNYDSLASIYASRANISAQCLDPYILKVMSTSMGSSVARYQAALARDQDYPQRTLMQGIRIAVPEQIEESLRFNGRHWTCTWVENNETIPCPINADIKYGGLTRWNLVEPSGFEQSLETIFGVPRGWYNLGVKNLITQGSPDKPGCPATGDCAVVWEGYPVPLYDQIILPIDPRSSVQATIGNLQKLDQRLAEILTGIQAGTFIGSPRNVTHSFALPYLMVQQAVQSYEEVALPEKVPPRNRAYLISTIKSIILTMPAIPYEQASGVFENVEQLMRLSMYSTQRMWPTFQAATSAADEWRIYEQFRKVIAGLDPADFDQIALLTTHPERQSYMQYDIFTTPDYDYLRLLGRSW
ncbi:hypothetical protein CAC42_6392 [Sphaceloma murrayae]|uniref:Uncharacterized protein n=1 Tax=Sphaceloma murrayae TaxID=2082308 RepID=A0A2K1QMA2_9PEZI|nr:hypothetical protein CAC42_6392 [Sphaceloma murrayae]